MNKRLAQLLGGAALVALAVLVAAPSPAGAQGTAFTYQGQLGNGTAALTGTYDFQFTLFATNFAGSPIAGPVIVTNLAVNDGFFSTVIDFGPAAFTGGSNWLDIAVCTNGAPTYTELTPRQQVTPTPYAIFAESVNVAPPGGSDSTAWGFQALQSNSGTENTANGYEALHNNTTASDNTAEGAFALAADTTGGSNVALGANALQSNTNGYNNVAIGYLALPKANDVDNIAIGEDSMGSLISGGDENTAIGTYSMSLFTNGTGNIALGYSAGNLLSAGSDNIYLGNRGPGHEVLFPPPIRSYPAPETGVIRIGTEGTHTAAYIAGNVSLNGATIQNPGTGLNLIGGLNLDQGNQNRGVVQTNALVFGLNSGEGIGSLRISGYSDSWGLDFYTDFNNRMTITQSGNVGIGTTNPAEPLEVNGAYVLVDGGAAYDGNGSIDAYFGGSGAGSDVQIGSFNANIMNVGLWNNAANAYMNLYCASINNLITPASSGNVGINTTAPSQALEVNGNFALVDGGAAYNGNGPIDAYIGGDGSGSDVQIGSLNAKITGIGFWNRPAGAWMNISCSSITIQGGSDLAEPFNISSTQGNVPQGAVVVIDAQNPGRLKLSNRSYDTHVAGVVSGANGISPGIKMEQQGLVEGGKNVALSGRVYVQAEASNGAIEPGDLLTTSSTPGYAMKVTDHARAQGAILGKAMTGLSEGQGMVLVLVTLQ